MSGGIYMEIAGDGTNTWAGCELVFSLGADVWRFNDEVVGTVATHYAVAENIAAWASDAGRVWAPETFTTLYTEDDTLGRVKIGVARTGASFTWTPNAAMAAMMTWPTPNVGARIASTAGPVGTIWPTTLLVKTWLRHNRAKGVVARTGGYLPGIGATSLHRPEVRATLTELQVRALTDADVIASSPRRAHLYHAAEDAFRFVAAGDISDPRRTLGRVYSIGMDALG